jgi:hypothetical protein
MRTSGMRKRGGRKAFEGQRHRGGKNRAAEADRVERAIETGERQIAQREIAEGLAEYRAED